MSQDNVIEMDLGNGSYESITVNRDSNPKELAIKFCRKFEIDHKLHKHMQEFIQEQMNELFGSENDHNELLIEEN